MKATLEFQLPEDGEELAVYLNAHAYLRVLHGLRNEFRDMYKHKDIGWAQEAADILYNICDEEGVDLSLG